MTFYFDVVCPFAYLAAERISRLPEAVRKRVDWVPVHLGGLLQQTGSVTNPMTTMSDARLKMNRIDLRRWSNRLNLPLMMPEAHPQRTTDAMRHLCTLEGDERQRVARAYFRAYWSSGSAEHWQNLEKSIREMLDASNHVSICDENLRAYTAQAINKGACGVPSFAVGDQLFWGQDRLFQALSELVCKPIDEAISLDPIQHQEMPTCVEFFTTSPVLLVI